MKGSKIHYSAEEMEWLEANRLLPITEYHEAFCQHFQRFDVAAANLHALRKRKGWKTGRTGQFVKGGIPVNKGVPCAPGTGGLHPNAQRYQFRKGQLPHNAIGAGHERIDSKDGYVVMIVDEVNPWTGAATRPVHKHRYLWEKLHGPIPDDHILKCLDGDKTNCDPSNWELVDRGVLPRINGGKATRVMAYDTAPPELKPAILTLARLEQKASQLRRKHTRGEA